MSVICPACDARFRDPPAHVAPSRPLQCGFCEHEWVRATVSAPSMAPGLDDLCDTGLVVRDETAENPARAAPIFVDALASHAPASAMRHTGLLAAGLFGLAVLTGGVLARDPIIAMVPQTGAVYAAIGLGGQADTLSAGLSITNVTTTRSRKDGISQLIVRGEIANAASAVVPVPALKLTMRGAADQKVYAWTAKASADNLAAGEKSTFTAVATDYPESAVDVEVTFEPLSSGSTDG